jgi:hypothetical protein
MRNGVSEMLHCVALVRTDGSEELSASIVRVTRIRELGTALARATDARCEEILCISFTGVAQPVK